MKTTNIKTQSWIIYADLECLLEKMSPYINPEPLSYNNSEKSSTAKINEHTLSGYSLFMHCLFNTTENKLDCYEGKVVWEIFIGISESIQQK